MHRIRSELENKLRHYAERKQETTSSGKESSFEKTMQAAQSSKKVPVTPQSNKLAERNHSNTPEPLHHVNRQLHKNITLDQAHKLARYAPIIQECARKHNVRVDMICAVILQESGGNPKASSPAGAKGLMQLMPQTAKRFGVTNILDPRQNIEGGTKYLRFLMDRFNGDYKLVLAAYNSGEGNVEKYGNKIPPFAETQNYVPSVLSYADTIYNILNTPIVSSSTLPPHAKKV